MLKLALGSPAQPLRRILCLGAHCDDIEIGCGGTVLRLLESHDDCEVYWLVFTSTPERKREAEQAADLFLNRAKTKRVIVRDYRDGFLPYAGNAVKDEFESLKSEFAPDLILTHQRNDLHQDHRLICELTWNTFRNHLILEYEIPKYDGDFGSPNLFVELDERLVESKLDRLFRAFKSQDGKHWFTKDFFSSVMRLRGVEANSHTRFAEAFYTRKVSL
jgi:LmbE family N-acetylglucosaminyl deacetylase